MLSFAHAERNSPAKDTQDENTDNRYSSIESSQPPAIPIDPVLMANDDSSLSSEDDPDNAFDEEEFERELANALSQNIHGVSLPPSSERSQLHTTDGSSDFAAGIAAALEAATRRDSIPSNNTNNIATGAQTRTAPAFHSLTSSNPSSSTGNDASTSLYLDTEPITFHHEAAERSDLLPEAESRHVSPSPLAFPGMDDVFRPFSDYTDNITTTEFDASPVVSSTYTSSGHSQPFAIPNLTSARGPPKPIQPIDVTSSYGSNSFSQSTKPRTAVESGSHVCRTGDCGKTFTRKSDLTRHQRIHTGVRPYVCSEEGCSRSFIQNSALQVHLRVHSGEKPHECEYPGCDRTFGDSSSLARHRRTHTGRRPYKCENPGCEKTFTRRTTLTTHMRTHDPYWKPDPSVRFKKQKVVLPSDDIHDIQDSVREISAIFQGKHATMEPNNNVSPRQPIQAQVASISAEIAAAIAQAQSNGYPNNYRAENDEDEAGEDSSSGQDIGVRGAIRPNTSGIRGSNHDDAVVGASQKQTISSLRPVMSTDGGHADAISIPLRPRKAKDPMSVVGMKRKR